MRVGVEGKVLSPAAGGIGRYAVRLIAALLEADADAAPLDLVAFTAPQSDAATLAGLPHRLERRPTAFRSSVLRCVLSLPAAARRARLDLFHGLDHVGVPLRDPGCPRVLTLHDLLPITRPDLYPQRHRRVVATLLPRSLTAARRILVPTRAVLDELAAWDGAAAARATVVPEGCDGRFRPGEVCASVRRRYGLPAAYILHVGSDEPRKNRNGLRRAVARVDDAPPLVLVGGETTHPHALGFVPDDDLPDIYRGAALFVFPSLAEGFGLPLLEAMRSGVPVVASDIPAIAEVAAGAALLVDPLSTDALADAIHRGLTDSALRQRLRRRGLERAAELTWERTARSTRRVYAEALA